MIPEGNTSADAYREMIATEEKNLVRLRKLFDSAHKRMTESRLKIVESEARLAMHHKRLKKMEAKK